MSVQTAPAARASAVDPWLVGLPSEPRDARLYRRMRFIRRFEETLLGLFEEGVLNGTTHACIGQEADAVGVIEHLRERRPHLQQPPLPRPLSSPAPATRWA